MALACRLPGLGKREVFLPGRLIQVLGLLDKRQPNLVLSQC